MPELAFVHKAILALVADPSMYENLPDEAANELGNIPARRRPSLQGT